MPPSFGMCVLAVCVYVGGGNPQQCGIEEEQVLGWEGRQGKAGFRDTVGNGVSG